MYVLKRCELRAVTDTSFATGLNECSITYNTNMIHEQILHTANASKNVLVLDTANK